MTVPVVSGIYLYKRYKPFVIHFVFPCQSGKLQIFELASGSLLEAVDAHDGAVWSLCLAPDQVSPTASSISDLLQYPFLTSILLVLLPSLNYLSVVFYLLCPAEGDRHRKCR